MLINPDKMILIYRGARFNTYELERSPELEISSRISISAPICASCLFTNHLVDEDRQHIIQKEEILFECGIEGCYNMADFFITLDFGFEEGDIEEEQEENHDSMEDLYDSELNFD
jgi:hypothetical protein